MNLEAYKHIGELRVALQVGNGIAFALVEGVEIAESQGLPENQWAYFSLVYAQEMNEDVIDSNFPEFRYDEEATQLEDQDAGSDL